MHRRLLPIFLFLTFFIESQAGHAIGGVITYRALDTFKFEVTYTFYRDCRGVAFSGPNASVSAVGGPSRSLGLTLVSVQEITPYHDTLSGGCSPSNTTGTGEGVERHVYRGTVDFNASPFNIFRDSCNIIFSTGICCRTSSINTGAANQNFYNYASLNLCQGNENSSPSPSYEPHAILCCNQPVYMNFGFLEQDGDSVSYAWDHPMSSASSTISYSGTYYGYNHPFQVYYPGTLTPPYTNPNAIPPIGIYLDAQAGDVIFTPTSCSEVTVAVIKVTEWRKDTSGTYQPIGVVRFDQLYYTKSCPNNNPAEIDGPFAYAVCEGNQLCFNITTDDNVYIPPPPLPAPAPDTVEIRWNAGIDSATFTVLSDTARLQTGRFCWTPPLGSARSVPYTFTVQANDNASPLNSVVERTFRVYVKRGATASTTITSLGCGAYEVTSSPDSSFAGSPSYRWQVLDSSGQIVGDPNVAAFSSTGAFLSVKQKDTIHIQRNGRFLIQHVVNNSPQNCPKTYLDTLQVTSVVESALNFSDSTLCPGQQVQLQASSSGSAAVAYRWLRNGDTLSTTTNYLDIQEYKAGDQVDYRLVIYDANGCTSIQDASIHVHPTYFPLLADTVQGCDPDLILSVDSPMVAFFWSTGSTDSSITVGSSGLYSVKMTDSFGCHQTHGFEAILHSTPSLQLADIENCADPVIVDAGAFTTYLWDDSTTARFRMITQSGVYHVTVTDSNGCKTADSLQVSIHDLPIPELRLPDGLCCDAPVLDLNTLIVDSNRTGGSWSSTVYPADLSNGSFDPAQVCAPFTTGTPVRYRFTDSVTGCFGVDSVTVQVHPLPRVELRDSIYCRDEQLVDLGKDLVRYPANPYNGIFGWSCVDCNGNPTDSIIEDRGKFGFPAYFLWLREDHYQMKNPHRDTVELAYFYTDQRSCTQRDSLRIYIDATPDTPVISKQGRWLYSSVPQVQWFFNGDPIDGAIGDSLYLEEDGRYYAKGTVETSCKHELSNQINVVLSVDELSALGISILPNPHTGQFELRLGSSAQLLELRLYDARGREVELDWHKGPNGYTVQSKGSKGTYQLHILTDKGMAQHKLIQL